MAKLQRAVILRDPNRARDLAFQPGDEPDPEYAVLITNPHCWEGDKLPAAVKRHLAAQKAAEEGQAAPAMETALRQADPTQAQDDSGEGSSAAGDDTAQAAPTARKTAASKRAASKPARGRDAAGEGDSGE